jgi:hypothetical protein
VGSVHATALTWPELSSSAGDQRLLGLDRHVVTDLASA